MQPKKLAAEAIGTALLVFFAVGVATLTFGFKLAGASTAAGVVATAFAFGLVLLVLAYALGPISGCHVNPAVTLGFVVARRMPLREAVGYWVAQVVGGIARRAPAVGRVRLRVRATTGTRPVSAPTASAPRPCRHQRGRRASSSRWCSPPCSSSWC